MTSANDKERSKGLREQIKAAQSREQAKVLLANAYRLSEKAQRRCQRAFDQLPFPKEES